MRFRVSGLRLSVSGFGFIASGLGSDRKFRAGLRLCCSCPIYFAWVGG